MFRCLIVGLKRVNAGKTVVAQALLLYFRELGVKACGFKPKAGNTLWYDYDVVREALSQGRLYGKDSKLLRIATENDVPEELVNPVHRLWAIPPHNLKENLALLPYFIVDRVTLWKKKRQEIIVINDTLPFKHGRETLVSNLHLPEREVIHLKTLRELNQIEKLYNEAITQAYDVLKKKHDAIVYESYSDIAIPWKGIKAVDLIMAAHPGYIQVYDSKKYFTALNLSKSMLREERTGKIVELLKPIETIRIQPHREDEIIEAVERKIRTYMEAESLDL